ncbi:MAG: mechanosensitive ion channel family protein [Sulfuricella denitrificans]|nr:mechanosensitive ion channel family protein [Sulfuricella denitrificans]
MGAWLELFPDLPTYLPALAVAVIFALLLRGANWLLLGRHPELNAELRLPRQFTLLLFGLVGVLVVLLLFPMSDVMRGQVLSLFGLVLTGVIALSSTTFVANAMAGLMLRSVGNFRSGDFVRVGEQFGRVTQRGLFHTEIQTEERELTTLPNLYLVNNPLTVVRTSGTIVSATLSLGYDIPRKHIEDLLKRAAEEAGLEDPFVQVRNLGDFSVSYRVAGFLAEIKQLLTARSNLQKSILDVLHGEGVEIVSPSFMNQRPLPDGYRVIPKTGFVERRKKRKEPVEEAPETLIFDKAEEAEKLEWERKELADLKQHLEALEALKDEAAEAEHARIEAEIGTTRHRLEVLSSQQKNGV